MNIAYLILAYKNIEQIYTLIDTLDHQNSFIFVHIDKKCKVKIAEEYFEKKNVVFLSQRMNVAWGGYSTVEVTLLLMELALNYEIQPDYYILLSGQCFPIKSNKMIFNFFAKNSGKIFMDYHKMPDSSQINGGMHKIEFYWYLDQLKFLNRYLRKYTHKTIHGISKWLNFKRKYLPGFDPYFGSQWWALPAAVVKYVLKFVDQNKSFVNFYKYTFAPDEMFFHTIICNSGFKRDIKNKLFRYLDWNTNGPPRILSMNDFDDLKKSPQLFARKFDISQEKEIIAALVEHINEE